MLRQYLREIIHQYNDGQCVPLKSILSEAVKDGIYNKGNVQKELESMVASGELTFNSDKMYVSLK